MWQKAAETSRFLLLTFVKFYAKLVYCAFTNNVRRMGGEIAVLG